MQPMLNIALKAARKAGDYMLKAFGQIDLKIETKGTHDYVTQVDKTAERLIIEIIHKSFPHHRILSEECGELAPLQSAPFKPKTDPRETENVAPEDDFVWIIDPLDGTRNFIAGIPHFAVSIAVQHRHAIQHAVVLDPLRQEEFTASRGAGAQLNNRRIRVGSRLSLEGALLGSGFAFIDNRPSHLNDHLSGLQALIQQGSAVRQSGSAALDLAYVAAGRLDGFWQGGLQPWDIAGGALLVQEAGGLISNFSGDPDFYLGATAFDAGNIACGNAKVLKGLLQTIKTSN